MKKTLLCILLAGMLTACAPGSDTTAVKENQPAISDASVNQTAAADVSGSQPAASDTAESRADTAGNVAQLAEEGAVCGTDGKLACPLVKPVENMTVEYDRTPEQEALMEAFDGLSLEDKIVAIDQGLIVCTEFIHDEKWEHMIDPHIAALAGEKGFADWMVADDACHSIYHFANAFGLTYADLEKVIQENQLTAYDLDALKKGMEKWCAQ